MNIYNNNIVIFVLYFYFLNNVMFMFYVRNCIVCVMCDLIEIILYFSFEINYWKLI